jgi:hypothetical protein
VKWFLHGSTIGLKEESNLPPLVNIFAPEDMNREVWKVEAAELTIADFWRKGRMVSCWQRSQTILRKS